MIRAVVFLALGFVLASVLRPRVIVARPGWYNSPSWTRDSSAGFGESGW
jgi:hypothetical protein